MISDRCVSVNALYSPMANPENGNVISSVGVVAVDNSGRCVGVRVGLDNQCVPVLKIGATQRETSQYNSNGVIITKRLSRVRLSVPNCENAQLVIWLSCETQLSQGFVQFTITRGINLRPTSHGLIGRPCMYVSALF